MSNKGTFITHCGARLATIDEVANVVTPSPTGLNRAGNATHFPVPHIALYEEIDRAIRATGMVRTREVHALHAHKNVEASNYFGMAELAVEDDAEYGMVIGWRSSHTKAYAASTVLGDRVFICDNLAFSGEVKMERKHTMHIMRDLPRVVSGAVGRVIAMKTTQDQRISAYKQRVVTEAESDHAIINMLRARAIPSSDVMKVVAEFEKPRHEEHLNEDGQRTVWTLFNSVTEVSTKGTNIFVLPRKTQALHGICDSLAGVGGLLKAA